MDTVVKEAFWGKEGQPVTSVTKRGLELEYASEDPVTVKVIGIGGVGCNIVSGFALKHPHADCIYANTDTQALQVVKGNGVKIRLGPKLCKGLAPGVAWQLGAKAAEESRDEIRNMIMSPDIVILVAGMGGSTGSGALPAIAEMAGESGALCIAVVTTPLLFEGKKRMQQAMEAVEWLRRTCDAVVVLPNEQIRLWGDKKVNLAETFKISDEKVKHAVYCLWDTALMSGTLCVDMADLKAAFRLDGRMVCCGTGVAAGPERLQEAFDAAMQETMRQIETVGRGDRLQRMPETSVKDDGSKPDEDGNEFEIPEFLRKGKSTLAQHEGYAEKPGAREAGSASGHKEKPLGNCLPDKGFYDPAPGRQDGRTVCLLYICSDEIVELEKLDGLLSNYAVKETGNTIRAFKYVIEKTWKDKASVTVFVVE